MAQNLDISVVIPLLNEEESLPELSSWIDRVMRENEFSYEILFVDDGSTDDSWEVIEALRRENEHIRGIRFRRNYGKSAALNTAFKQTKGKVVITMDADLQDSPEEIPELYSMIVEDKYDIVSGWKKKRHDPIFSKNLPSKLFNWAARKMSGIYLHDFNCGLKSYDAKVVKNIEVFGEMHRYIPIIAKWAGFGRITEKPVAHQARKYGVSKFGMERFINGLLDLVTIFFIGKFGKRPMHFFGSLGFGLFLCGFILLSYLSIDKLFFNAANIDQRPLFYLGILVIIVGSQLFLAGFVSEIIVRNSRERNKYEIEEYLGVDDYHLKIEAGE